MLAQGWQGAQKAFADVMPYYSSQIRYPGIGIFNAPKSFVVYSEPCDTSKPLEHISWSGEGINSDRENIYENDLFIAFLPRRGVAFMTVSDEQEGWVQVYYSQKSGKVGWVKTTDVNKYSSWLSFYMNWGRKNGVYMLKDAPEANKTLRTAPNDEAQPVGSFLYPKFIKMTLVRGNWLMVSILDFGDEKKVGWINWRDKNGKIYIFPTL